MPTKKEELPGTIQRSPSHAQAIYTEALDSAHEQYDSEARAHRVAYAALKDQYEKRGDHWEPKRRKGPSDEQAEGGRRTNRPTAGGVDVKGHNKRELIDRAGKLGVTGRWSMSKHELGQAIARQQD